MLRGLTFSFRLYYCDLVSLIREISTWKGLREQRDIKMSKWELVRTEMDGERKAGALSGEIVDRPPLPLSDTELDSTVGLLSTSPPTFRAIHSHSSCLRILPGKSDTQQG